MAVATLQYVIDFATVACFVVLCVIAAEYLVIIAKFLSDERSGAADPVPPQIGDDELPAVLVQVPVYNEAAVVEQSIRSVSRLSWPRDRLHIQILDDSDDDTPQRAMPLIAELARNGVQIAHVRRPDRRGFKGGACAAGAALCPAPFIAILDADFTPPAHWLRATVPLLAANPEAGFVQSRCEYPDRDRNIVTKVQGLIQDAAYMVEQRTRARAGWIFQFNGTGGVWRRSAIESVGGWSEGSLVEDLDLTVRTALAGWKGIFLTEPAVPGQLPDRLKDFQVQQSRWSNGFVQVASSYFVPILRTRWPLANKVMAIALLLRWVTFPALAAGIFVLVAGTLFYGSLWPFVPYLSVIMLLVLIIGIGMTLPPYLKLRRGTIASYASAAAALPAVVVYLALANSGKIVRTMLGRDWTFDRTPKRASE